MLTKAIDTIINATLDHVAEEKPLAGNVHIRRLLAQTLKQSINVLNTTGNASHDQREYNDHAAHMAHHYDDYSDHTDHNDHNDYSDYEDFWNPGSCSSVTW